MLILPMHGNLWSTLYNVYAPQIMCRKWQMCTLKEGHLYKELLLPKILH